MSTRIQVRRGTASEWSSSNPVLAPGEIGFETDTGFVKMGDGITAWEFLPIRPIRFSASSTLDFGSIPAHSTSELTFAFSGAVVGAPVTLVPPTTLESGLMFSGYIQSNDVVAVRLANVTAVAIDPASASWTASIVW